MSLIELPAPRRAAACGRIGPSDLRQRQGRGREQVFGRKLAVDDALFHSIAADRRQFATVGLDAVGPEIVAHQGAGARQLLNRPGQCGEQMADGLELAITDLLRLLVGYVCVRSEEHTSEL